MPMIFYPHEGELDSSTAEQKLEVLLECAERYKALMLDTKNVEATMPTPTKRLTPRDMNHVFNWEEVAKLLRELRDYPEGTPSSKVTKAERLTKLAAVYEVLRGAKMPKLEAVRLALINEANQLRSGSSKVA